MLGSGNINKHLATSHISEASPVSESRRDFLNKISQIDDTKINVVSAKIKQFIGYVGLKIAGLVDYNAGLTWMTNMSAEHMSQGSLAGNFSTIANKKIINLLNNAFPNPDPEIKNVIKSLTYVNKINSMCDINNIRANNCIKKDIQELQVGESITIPSDKFQHAMMMSIKRIEDDEGKKPRFAIFQYNEGSCLEYHYSKLDDEGRQQSQAVLEITNIDGEKLYGPNSTFISQVLSKSMKTQELYEKIIPQLKGEFVPPRLDPGEANFWSFGQMGGSCTCACQNAFIRSQLSAPSYNEFRTRAKTESLIRMYRQIKSGWGNQSMRRLVALEVVKQLESGVVDNNLSLGLEKIRIGLQQKPIIKVQTKKTTKTNLQKFNFNLRRVLKIVRDSHDGNQAITEAMPLLDEIRNIVPEKLKKKDVKVLVEITKEIKSNCQEHPLNSEQIYLLAIISCIIMNKFAGCGVEEKAKFTSQIKNHWNFTQEMLRKFSVLELDKTFKYESYNFIVEHFMRKIRKKMKNQFISSSMQRMIDNSVE